MTRISLDADPTAHGPSLPRRAPGRPPRSVRTVGQEPGTTPLPVARLRPEQELALGVIERCVADLHSGNRALRDQARYDVRAGRLGPWLDELCEDGDVAERAHERLRVLAGGA